CPDAGLIQLVVEERASASEQAEVLAHAEECESCRALIAAALERPAERPSEPAPGSPGTHIGPFLVTGVLGLGGMGVVVAAHAPDLDRDVAIKILRADRLDSSSDAEAQARLLREAQALAKLSHANVITVHQVGTVGDRVYVVMDKVAGTTLRGWLQAAPR